MHLNIEGSYFKHPAFKFNQNPWVLKREAFLEFNQAYVAYKKISTTLSKPSKKLYRTCCINALGDIFSSLISQAGDFYEKNFLIALHEQSYRLLLEEFWWFDRVRPNQFVNFNGHLAIKNSIEMERNRNFLGKLSLECLHEIRRLSSENVDKFRLNALSGNVKRSDLSINEGSVIRKIRDLLNKEFKSLGILDILGAYAGCRVKVTGLALELSVPQATWWRGTQGSLVRPPHTAYAHLDEGVAYPKAIVYLSDVGEMNGPTSCYPEIYEALNLNPLQEIIGRVIGNVGVDPASTLNKYYSSHYHQAMSSENFRRHYMLLPKEIRFNSHFGWDILPDSQAENLLVENEKKVIGSAGSFIVFDGARLLHRGGLIESGERLALQIIFSNLTFFDRIVNKVKRIGR